MKKIVAIFFVIVLPITAWLFVGIDRHVGDHEVGITWEPFFKHRPNFRIVFSNPAQQGLEIRSFKELSIPEKTRFLDYCLIRLGKKDPERCQQQINENRV